MSSPFERTGRPRHSDVLTPAEWEVLAGVRDGLANREIADRRGCDLETVRFHLRNLRRKLAVQSRDELRAFPGRPAPAIQQASQVRTVRRIREQIPLIETRDMRAALDFYLGALGFEIISRWPDEGDVPGWAALGSGGARLMLRVFHPDRQAERSPTAGTVTLSLYVEGVDAFRRDLVSKGHRCGRLKRLFYGAREFSVSDPDGNDVALVEFAASDPRYLATRAPSKKESRA